MKTRISLHFFERLSCEDVDETNWGRAARDLKNCWAYRISLEMQMPEWLSDLQIRCLYRVQFKCTFDFSIGVNLNSEKVIVIVNREGKLGVNSGVDGSFH